MMCISQVDIVYIDFNVHLLVADLQRDLLCFTEPRKAVGVMVVNVGDNQTCSLCLPPAAFATVIGTACGIPSKVYWRCAIKEHPHTLPLTYLSSPSKGKRCNKGD